MKKSNWTACGVRRALGVSVSSLALLSSSALAQPADTLRAELDRLHADVAVMLERIEEVEQRLERAESAESQVDKSAAAKATQAAAGEPQGSPMKVKWEPAPSIASPDGLFEMNIRGRLYADAAFANDANDSMNVDATELRSARLGIEGKAWSDIKYVFEVDFAGEKTTINDAYLNWKGNMPAAISVGYFKTPNSLEEQTSSRFTTFMERASFTDAFELERQIGLALSSHGKNWAASLGVFRGSAGSAFAQEGAMVAGRATFSPTIGDAQVHLGGSFRYRDNAPGQPAFHYRQRPHLHLADALIATPNIAESDLFYGAETALLLGALTIQAEYSWLDADLVTAAPGIESPTFSGGYVDVSWFLTGEHRAYNPEKGVFERVKVNRPVFDGGPGAWQAAVRWDRIDLSDGSIFGGEQNSIIVGVNWHLNPHARMMFNFAHSEIREAFDLTSSGDLNGKNSADVFGARAQADW